MANEAHDLESAAQVISGILNPGQTSQAAASAPAPEQPVREPQPTQTPAETPDVQIPTEDEPTQVATAQDEGVTDDAEQPATEPEKPQEAAQDDVSEIELEPEQVASLLGLEDDSRLVVTDDGLVKLTAKVDGEVRQVSLQDLTDGYQLASTSQKRLSKLAEDRKVFERERSESLQALANQQQQLATAVQAIEQAYLTDFNAINWDQLRNDDPTEYNLKRTEYSDRFAKINQFKQGAQAQAQQANQQQMARAAQMQAEGAERLADIFSGSDYKTAPAWDDAEKQRLFKWIEKDGYSPQQIASVTDHRVFRWARDSMLYHEQLEQAKATAKRVVRLPKVSKPGTRQDQGKAAKQTRVTAAKSKQRQAKGNLDSTTALIREIFTS